MLSKGLVRVFMAALTIVCLYYLSFSVVTSVYSNKAREFAAGDKAREQHFLDSLAYERVWLGYTLKESREREINLGLDLRGGMNVILEVSVPDIIRALSGHNQTESFNNALALAIERQRTNSNVQFLDLFVQAFTEIDPHGQLAAVFSTFDMRDRISLQTSNDEVIRILRGEIDGAVSNSFNVLRTRIDRFGVVQPNIQRLGNTGRILIELPGVKEPERVRRLLQGSANLEFWETYELNEIFGNLAEANRVLANIQSATETARADETAVVAENESDETVTETDELRDLLAAQTDVADDARLMEDFRRANPLFSLTGTDALRGMAGPLVGVVSSRDTARVMQYLNMPQIRELFPRDLDFRWSVNPRTETGLANTQRRGDNFELIAIRVTNRDGRAPLSGDVITDARAEMGQQSVFASVSMAMNSEGANIWARMTRDNIGRCIAIVLDNFVYSYPRVNTEITGGRSEISGTFTIQEATDLANVLRSGRMPAPARIIQEDIVGPSLGQQAIRNGLISFVIAFILIMLYMVFFYGRIPGLIADLALIANIFFLFGILASFGAVLTLPGIAGIVLTLGMAIDGNVLIYERIREEMRAGKNMKRAIEEGFGNAISAIIDVNVTTLITAAILMYFGTGPIQGFATTLFIGSITSFVTSVFLTRSMLQWYANREKAKELPFTTNVVKNWLLDTKFAFIEKRKIGYIISGVAIAVCILSFSTRGLSLGIDFVGGRNYVIRFEQPVPPEQVRSLLENAFDGVPAQVITIGSNDQVRISTRYKIYDTSDTVNDDIETILFENLRSLLGSTVTQEMFVRGFVTDQNDNASLAPDGFATFGVQSSQKVGPTIADDIKRAAVFAIIFAIIAIGLYVFIRFREFGYSLGAIAGLSQDAFVTIGIYSLLYNIVPWSMEIDQSFVAAILTVVGYSVNDKVVVFDRIRENVKLYPKRDRSIIINDSINATLRRTFSTSISTLVVLVAIFIFGGDTIRGFVFAMMFGIAIATYSSIFIAAPIAYQYFSWKNKKVLAKAEAEGK